MVQTLLEKAVAGTGCSPTEARALLDLDEPELFRDATRVREAHFGNQIQLCSIINAKSGRCDMDCRFCSQSGHSSTPIEEYPFLPSAELADRIRRIVETADRHCGVVTSGGKLSGREIDRLANTVRGLASPCAPVCASLGRLAQTELRKLKQAGVERFHHNLETSESFYPRVCSTQTWAERVETVRAAQRAGLEVCCGGLFGLGEDWPDRIDLAVALRDLGIDSVPINFLYAHAGTPLAAAPPLSAADALRIVALYRFLLPTATLRICGGRTHVLGDRQAELFAAGANGLMTGNYLTVAGSQYQADLDMLRQLGLRVSPA